MERAVGWFMLKLTSPLI